MTEPHMIDALFIGGAGVLTAICAARFSALLKMTRAANQSLARELLRTSNRLAEYERKEAAKLAHLRRIAPLGAKARNGK